MTDIIIVFVVALLVGGAAGFIYISKKRGKKCIGCPDSGGCSGSCGGCSCGCAQK